MVEPFANSGGPDQTLCSRASDLGLHYLPVTHLGVSSLQWGMVGIMKGLWCPNTFRVCTVFFLRDIFFFFFFFFQKQKMKQQQQQQQASIHLTWNLDKNLTLSTLGKIFSRRHFEIFFLFFPENRI